MQNWNLENCIRKNTKLSSYLLDVLKFKIGTRTIKQAYNCIKITRKTVLLSNFLSQVSKILEK